MHRTRNDLSLRTRTAMVELLNARLADAAGETAGDAGDEGTGDLFTGISRDTDKYLWMLEAHL